MRVHTCLGPGLLEARPVGPRGAVYGSAQAMYGQLGAPGSEADALAGLAEMAERLGRRDEACSRYARAAALFRQTDMGAQFWLPWIAARQRDLGCEQR